MARKTAGSRAEVLFPLAALLLDALAVVLSFGLAYWLRFHTLLTVLMPPVYDTPPLTDYLAFSGIAVPIFLVVFATRGLYRLHHRVSLMDEFQRVARSTLLALPWMFAAAFFYRQFSYSRGVFMMIALISVTVLTAERAFIQSLQRKLYRRGVGVLSAAICGTGALAQSIHERLQRNPSLGYRSLGFISVDELQPQAGPLLGNYAQIQEILAQSSPDLMIIALEPSERPRLDEIVRYCDGIDLDFLFAPDPVVVLGSKAQPETIAGLPLLKIKESPLFGWKGVVKRAFDLIGAMLMLIVLSPFLALIALLVKLDSRGPLIYSQERVGLDGRSFRIHKFRTMIPDAEKASGPVWAHQGDPRTTRLGRWLRRLSIDELPQLFNVLRGSMSLVGPRPERPHFVGQFRQEVPMYMERHRVRSGITGWAQVNGFRGNTSISERTRYDVYYVENWSLGFDLKIMMLTLREIVVGKQAY
jgi:exopolysaccharide biosynthesis polyprenyl glycosylphosphotransferase